MKKFIVALFILSSLAGNAYAQTPAAANAQFQFKPIVAVPLPTGSVDAQTSLPDYINGVFTLTIAVATILGVIMIVFDGFRYMASDAIGGKKEALAGIRGALFGLVLLLLSYVILNVINPQILALDALTKDLSALGGTAGSPSGTGVGAATVGGLGSINPSSVPAGTGSAGTARTSASSVPAGMELAPYTRGTSIPSGCSLKCSGGSSISTPQGTANACPADTAIMTLCPKQGAVPAATTPASSSWGWRGVFVRENGSGRATQQQGPFKTQVQCQTSLRDWPGQNNLLSTGDFQCNCNTPLSSQRNCTF